MSRSLRRGALCFSARAVALLRTVSRPSRLLYASLCVVIALFSAEWKPAMACPFCSAVSQTLSEEMASMDAAVIGRLIAVPKVSPAGASALDEVPKAKFAIVEILKGETALNGVQQIEALCFGDVKAGDKFLIMGVDPPRVAWTTPMKVSDRAIEYLQQLRKLPEKGPDRLAFFQDYLEDEDAILSRDAYDEFARAPYAEVQLLEGRMDHDELVGWIRDLEIPVSHRRLYLVMLSVCGGPGDLPMLEQMLRAEDRKAKAGLDALIGAYLVLAGPAGMPLVEDLFLKNKDAEYADTYAAIMALRFHGSETDVIPRQRILEAFRHMLDRPQLADLVIPDLARWQDWSQMDRLATLFKDADEQSSWVRVPVINFLRACPKPEAAELIKELEKIDPEAVKRANTFFPFGGGASSPAPNDSSAVPKGSRERFVALSRPDDRATDLDARTGSARTKLSIGGAAPIDTGSRVSRDRLLNLLPVLSVVALAGCVYVVNR